jgi:hypothetical protein
MWSGSSAAHPAKTRGWIWHNWPTPPAIDWFPSRDHVRLLNALVQTRDKPDYTPEGADVLFNLGELSVPDPDEPTTQDVIAIRRHSAAFAAWRDCGEATYRQLRQHRDRDRAQTLLHGSVHQCLDQLQHDISSIWTGGIRGLVLGGVGATPGLIAHDGAGVELTAAGSIASLLAGLAWGHHEKRHQRHAIRAVEKHFVYLTEHLPHPWSGRQPPLDTKGSTPAT